MKKGPIELFTEEEITFLDALRVSKVRFMVAGMSAAILQGAPGGTKDIDLWFATLADPNIDAAARKAGGTLAWRASPPMIVGKNLDHIDIITTPSGLGSFESEYMRARVSDIYGVTVKVLPIERVIVSKRAAGRPKDIAALPSLQATVEARRVSGKK